MTDIIMAKARVVGVHEVTVKPMATVMDPTANFGEDKTVVASKLQIEPLAQEGFLAGLRGTMEVPFELPFNKTFHLVLHDPDHPKTDGGRKFNDEIDI